MAEKITVLITEEEIDRRVRELAAQISKDYEGRKIRMLVILKGASFFMCELAKRITVPVTIDFMLWRSNRVHRNCPDPQGSG